MRLFHVHQTRMRAITEFLSQSSDVALFQRYLVMWTPKTRSLEQPEPTVIRIYDTAVS